MQQVAFFPNTCLLAVAVAACAVMESFCFFGMHYSTYFSSMLSRSPAPSPSSTWTKIELASLISDGLQHSLRTVADPGWDQGGLSNGDCD
jgi:hypothetical protein